MLFRRSLRRAPGTRRGARRHQDHRLRATSIGVTDSVGDEVP
ncbi:hypothetical protein [Bradyrhizobium sp. WD16]|nr:hypothetical protein [Bradyrhizobium sp. WD16]